jgi:hypothetical protein
VGKRIFQGWLKYARRATQSGFDWVARICPYSYFSA